MASLLAYSTGTGGVSLSISASYSLVTVFEEISDALIDAVRVLYNVESLLRKAGNSGAFGFEFPKRPPDLRGPEASFIASSVALRTSGVKILR